MSLALLLKSGVAAPPPPSGTILTPVVEIDFTGNPTATYGDIQTTQDGVLSFWRMNSAATFLDTRLAHHGTIISTPTTTASPYTYDADLALQFDGTSDGAYVPSAGDLTTKGPMTIAGWLRVDTIAARYIVAKVGAWHLSMESTGKLRWTLKDDNSLGTVLSNSVLAVGTWYHVAATYNSSSISIYINGVLDVTGAYTAGWEAAPIPIRFAETPSGAVPTWQSSQTSTSISATATGTKPVSTAAGDLLLAYLHVGLNSQGVLSIPSAPAGWTLLSSVSGSSNNPVNHCITCQLYYKIAGASEPATYSWSVSTTVTYWVTITRITGVNQLTPIANPSQAVLKVPSSTAHTVGTHTPNVDNNMVVAFFSNETNSSWTESSGTERYDVTNGSNNAGMCTQTQATATALSVTGTGGTKLGAAMMVVVAGASNTYAAVSMKDWSFSSVARTASELARDYASRLSGDGTWTDVSTSVRSFSTTGAKRQYELDQMEAGTTSVLLKDENRYFDPANTSSIYAPNVIPMRKIRARTTYQSTVYDLFYAYIERWPPQGAIPGYQEIGLTVVDGFDALALADVTGPLDVGFSGAQIATLLDKALWPKSKRSLDQGQYVMAAQTLTGGGALGAIQEIANSERGIFFIDQAGVANFHDSAHRGSFLRSTTSQATFDDTGSSGIAYQGLEPSFDKDKIINEWTVSPDPSVFAAAAQLQTDAASGAQFWRRSKSRSTRLASNADALAQAGNLLNETSQPALRFDAITVLPTTAAAYATCLGLRISDRVTVVRGTAAFWDGSVLTKDCFIEARQVSALPGEPWVFTFALSPVSSGNYSATIKRDGPVSYWRMDTVT